MTRGERKTLWLGLAFISPWIVGVLVFTLYPVVASIGYSFCDYDVLSKPVWVGAMNYRDMALDAVFWKSLRNTLFFAAWALPLGLVVSLFTAVLLNQPVRGRSLFRTIFFLPSLVPVVAGGMIWLWILNGRFGLLNAGLAAIGIEGPQWLADENWTKPSIILMSLWGVGNYAVYLYQNAFEYRQMGYACAMAWVLFILILILTWAATRTTRRHIYYAGE